MTHPYSIFVYHAPRGWQSEGYWEEQVQVRFEQYALYVAQLIHNSGVTKP